MKWGHHRCTMNPFPFPADIMRMWDVWDNGKGIGWFNLEPSKGVYDWSTFDKMLNEHEEMGAEIVYCFGYTPEWTAQPTDSGVPGGMTPTSNKPPDIQDWTDWVYRLLYHVQRPDGTLRIKYWEMWNETNALGFWDGTNEQLLEMAQILWTAVKSKDPTALVTTPTPCMNATSAPEAMDTYLSMGFGDYADIITCHIYLSPGENALAALPIIEQMREVMAKYGCEDKPLWEDESGYMTSSFVPDNEKYKWVMNWIEAGIAGNLDARFWYEADNINDQGVMVLPDGTVNPGGQAWLDAYAAYHQDRPLPAVRNVMQVLNH